MQNAKFFTVHCIEALEAGQFSIVRANIENCPEKVALAQSYWPRDSFYYEFHNYTQDMRAVVR